MKKVWDKPPLKHRLLNSYYAYSKYATASGPALSESKKKGLLRDIF